MRIRSIAFSVGLSRDLNPGESVKAVVDGMTAIIEPLAELGYEIKINVLVLEQTDEIEEEDSVP